jgi:hypothetical protein
MHGTGNFPRLTAFSFPVKVVEVFPGPRNAMPLEHLKKSASCHPKKGGGLTTIPLGDLQRSQEQESFHFF